MKQQSPTMIPTHTLYAAMVAQLDLAIIAGRPESGGAPEGDALLATTIATGFCGLLEELGCEEMSLKITEKMCSLHGVKPLNDRRNAQNRRITKRTTPDNDGH